MKSKLCLFSDKIFKHTSNPKSGSTFKHTSNPKIWMPYFKIFGGYFDFHLQLINKIHKNDIANQQLRKSPL
jgi:hypothetical protein